jgi:hypothetical protein
MHVGPRQSDLFEWFLSINLLVEEPTTILFIPKLTMNLTALASIVCLIGIPPAARSEMHMQVVGMFPEVVRAECKPKVSKQSKINRTVNQRGR